MKIDVFLTPFFPEFENQFNDSLVIMIDVLRASTTVCAALYHGAKEIIPCETTEKAVQIYSNLSREYRFLAGEKNGIKQTGFDAGNSPSEYSEYAVKGKTVVMTTTNGTRTFARAKQAKHKIIGAFVNIAATVDFINNLIAKNGENNFKINILCAGNNGRFSFEDAICAGAYIHYLSKSYDNIEMTDSALASKSLYNQHADELSTFLKTCDHARYLQKLGFGEDIEIALTFDLFPVIPILTGNSIQLQNSII
jgi:2-phosphosulfolactate phosphatase